LTAFSVPVTAFMIFLVASSDMLFGLLTIRPARRRSDPGARRRQAQQTHVGVDRRRLLDHTGLGSHDLERRNRRRGDGLSLGLREVKSLIWHRGEVIKEAGT
jgi:hypothetical protein